MSDQCRACTCRGHLDECLAVECHHHRNWIFKALTDRLRDAGDEQMDYLNDEDRWKLDELP